MTEILSESPATDEPAAAAAPDAAAPPSKRKQRPARNEVMPVLERLATLYPKLFGAEFLPLKRGVYQDLQAAHPGVFEAAALKAALAFHTRSSRYLAALAAGRSRFDLAGSAVEALAPEHVYQALLEVFRRRQARSEEDLTPKLVARIARAQQASGLSVRDYAECMRGRDEAANAHLDAAMIEAQALEAKGEALARAHAASGQSVEAFADMYGLDVRDVRRLLGKNA